MEDDISESDHPDQVVFAESDGLKAFDAIDEHSDKSDSDGLKSFGISNVVRRKPGPRSHAFGKTESSSAENSQDAMSSMGLPDHTPSSMATSSANATTKSNLQLANLYDPVTDPVSADVDDAATSSSPLGQAPRDAGVINPSLAFYDSIGDGETG